MNRPRNVLLTQADPREPVECKFQHSVGALRYSLTIHQTPKEETWPGGALWDCGVLLAEFLLAVAGIESLTTVHTFLDEEEGGKSGGSNDKASKKNKNNKKPTHGSKQITRTTSSLSNRLQTWLQKQQLNSGKNWKDFVLDILLHGSNLTVVELGCGVGLTGLVAAIALGAVTTILTDLTVVVDQVALPNVLQNTTANENNTVQRKNCKAPTSASASSSSSSSSLPVNYPCRSIRHSKGGGKVVALPLCWGNVEEGNRVLSVLQELQPSCQNTTATTKEKGKKGTKKAATATINPSYDAASSTANTIIYPDLILLGDVAYQHKPGAPSHFDILVESLRQLMPPITAESNQGKPQLLLFGTRLRMPASMDLLFLLQEYFTPVLQTPIPAEVLDPALQGVKHNMTIHIFTNKNIVPI